MDVVTSEDLIKAWSKKMAPPLVTLLSSEPEVRGPGARACSWPTAHAAACAVPRAFAAPPARVKGRPPTSPSSPPPPPPPPPPLPPQVQYVALRNINLIVQRRPGILSNEVKVFFCKYNDPLYVKMEKLEVMIRLANEKNIDQVRAGCRGWLHTLPTAAACSPLGMAASSWPTAQPSPAQPSPAQPRLPRLTPVP
jgi:hypothetical protein